MGCRVVVTGLGMLSSLGDSIEQNWGALIQGQSGIGPIESYAHLRLPVATAGEIKNFRPGTYHVKPKSLKVMNRATQLALAATFLALRDAGMDAAGYRPEDVGLALGVEGIQYTAEESLLACYEAAGQDMRAYLAPTDRRACRPIVTRDPDLAVHPLWPLSALPNMALCHVAIQHQLQGPNVAYSSIDAAGAQAVGAAVQGIRSGQCSIYLAGGTCALSTMHFLSLSSAGQLSEPAGTCRPFDRRRDGIVLGEGAAMLVIEELAYARRRGARIYAEIIGYGSSVAGTIGPAEQGLAGSMLQAFEDGRVRATDIDYVNADGKGAVEADRLEAAALKHALGSRGTSVPVSTSKPLTGHLLPASGAYAAAATILAVQRDYIPPTVNCTEPDPLCELNLITNPLKKEIKYAISNTFGIMGENSTLVFKKFAA